MSEGQRKRGTANRGNKQEFLQREKNESFKNISKSHSKSLKGRNIPGWEWEDIISGITTKADWTHCETLDRRHPTANR